MITYNETPDEAELMRNAVARYRGLVEQLGAEPPPMSSRMAAAVMRTVFILGYRAGVEDTSKKGGDLWG